MTNDSTSPDLIDRLRAYSHDYPCIHCESPVLEVNSRGQAICVRCLGENPIDVKGRTISEAADALEAAQARIAELERENAIIQAAKSGVTYVCPECDIAGCKHVRAALEGK